MNEWLKKVISFILAMIISYIIFYAFFALIGLTFKIIISFFHLALIVLVALPFYVLIKKKLFG
ncbi:MAG: hypothetical protein ACK4SO_01630 [Candidatus Kapaibacteriota bacterium]